MTDLEIVRFALAFAIAVVPLHPQTVTQRFDVASVKPSHAARSGGEGSGREKVTITPSSVTIENAGLSFSIQLAYGVKFYRASGPEWLVSERYDLTAKTETRSSKGNCQQRAIDGDAAGPSG